MVEHHFESTEDSYASKMYDFVKRKYQNNIPRKKSGIKVHALTCPLITKADGTKFGKTEEGNVWLLMVSKII